MLGDQFCSEAGPRGVVTFLMAVIQVEETGLPAVACKNLAKSVLFCWW